MPDKKLTDSEIKSILAEFAECGIVEHNIASVEFVKNVRNLINRLQAENERLKNAYKQVAWERDCFEADNKRLYEIIENKNIKTEEQ